MKKNLIRRKKVQNLKNIVKGTFCLCDKIPNKKPQDPPEILAWKVSLPIMADNAVDKWVLISIEKDLTQNEKDITTTFVKGYNYCKTAFGEVLYLHDSYGK